MIYAAYERNADSGHRPHLGASLIGNPCERHLWYVFRHAISKMKTHNAKSFKELTEKRVEKAKPLHYAQMQVYMGLSGMTRALYFAVNKDTDDIYTEYLHFDPQEFERLHARAARIISASEPPLRISEDPSWFQCKFYNGDLSSEEIFACEDKRALGDPGVQDFRNLFEAKVAA
jgi:hypothetical protein